MHYTLQKFVNFWLNWLCIIPISLDYKTISGGNYQNKPPIPRHTRKPVWVAKSLFKAIFSTSGHHVKIFVKVKGHFGIFLHRLHKVPLKVFVFSLKKIFGNVSFRPQKLVYVMLNVKNCPRDSFKMCASTSKDTCLDMLVKTKEILSWNLRSFEWDI